MSRMLRLGLALVVVSSAASVAYSQCGSGYHYGGYRQPYRSFWFPQYAPAPQRYCYQPQFPGGQPYYGYGGAPTYAVPQGSATRGYSVPPTYQSQPAYPSTPAYSAPQGSGSRSAPSQGSGSR